MQRSANSAPPPNPLDPNPLDQNQMQGRTLDIEQLAADDLEYNYDMAGLAALRRRLAAAIHAYKGAHAQYVEVRPCGVGWFGTFAPAALLCQCAENSIAVLPPIVMPQVVTSALVLQEVVKSRERADYEPPPGTLGAGGSRDGWWMGGWGVGRADVCSC